MANNQKDQEFHNSIISESRDDSIKIVKIEKKIKQGNIKAFATIQAKGFTVFGCKIIQQPNQKAWVALPQTQSNDKWFPVIEAEPDLKEAISQAILKAWELAL